MHAFLILIDIAEIPSMGFVTFCTSTIYMSSYFLPASTTLLRLGPKDLALWEGLCSGS